MWLPLAALALGGGCALGPPVQVEEPGGPSGPIDAVVAAMLGHPLVYTRHARCRMDCRDIDEGEVEQLLRDGTRKLERTREDGECPSHALEGRTRDGQRVRIVYAACSRETRVVTAIDLDQESDCVCP